MAVSIEGGPKPVTLSVSFSSSGDNTVVASLPNQQIRILSLFLTCASAVDVTLKDGGTTLGVFQGLSSLALDPLIGHSRFILTADNAFIINLSSAVACKGVLWYTQN